MCRARSYKMWAALQLYITLLSCQTSFAHIIQSYIATTHFSLPLLVLVNSLNLPLDCSSLSSVSTEHPNGHPAYGSFISGPGFLPWIDFVTTTSIQMCRAHRLCTHPKTPVEPPLTHTKSCNSIIVPFSAESALKATFQTLLEVSVQGFVSSTGLTRQYFSVKMALGNGKYCVKILSSMFSSGFLAGRSLFNPAFNILQLLGFMKWWAHYSCSFIDGKAVKHSPSK